jgi:hypothetical protein
LKAKFRSHLPQRNRPGALLYGYGKRIRLRRRISPRIVLIVGLACALAASALWLSFQNRAALGAWLEESREAAVFLLGVVLLAAAIWMIPVWQCRRIRNLSAEMRFDKENESRKTVAQVIGGLLVILSLFAAQQTFRLTQEGQFSDRYTKALSLLGEPQPELRLGGIFALERLARQSTEDDGPMIDVLAAYIRLYAPWPPRKPEGRRDAEVVTSLRVLGRRTAAQRARESVILNLSQTDLHGFVLDNLNLRDIDFHEAHLEGSTLRGTSLAGSFLLGAHLEGALVASWDISQEQIDSACGDASTVLPANRQKPANWLKVPPVCGDAQ